MPRTILVVEDCDNAAPLEIALTAMTGIEVLTLRNGNEAVKLIHNGAVDLAAVVTDLNLPHADGFEIIRAVRHDERYSQLPVLVISGDSHPDTPLQVRLSGANAFFPKPYSPTEIRQLLEDLLHAQ